MLQKWLNYKGTAVINFITARCPLSRPARVNFEVVRNQRFRSIKIMHIYCCLAIISSASVHCICDNTLDGLLTTKESNNLLAHAQNSIQRMGALDMPLIMKNLAFVFSNCLVVNNHQSLHWIEIFCSKIFDRLQIMRQCFPNFVKKNILKANNTNQR